MAGHDYEARPRTFLPLEIEDTLSKNLQLGLDLDQFATKEDQKSYITQGDDLIRWYDDETNVPVAIGCLPSKRHLLQQGQKQSAIYGSFLFATCSDGTRWLVVRDEDDENCLKIWDGRRKGFKKQKIRRQVDSTIKVGLGEEVIEADDSGEISRNPLIDSEEVPNEFHDGDAIGNDLSSDERETSRD